MEAALCKRCLMGVDDDGDGNCGVCAKWSDNRARLHRIGKWAEGLRSYRWNPMSLADFTPHYFYAIKTDTGRILSGTGFSFRAKALEVIEPSYGRIVGWVRAEV
jgi:hypothetical protein